MQLEGDFNGLDRGIGPSARQLEDNLLRQEPVPQGIEPLQLATAFLGCLLRPQHEGRGGRRGP